MNVVEKGCPLFDSLQYCIRCCIPESQEGVSFDELGICTACRTSEEKMHINWIEREKQLRHILEQAKLKASDNYDCLIPISGGKDSTFQLHVLVKIYKMKPLAVTFSHNWFSKTGLYNLFNTLEKFNVDHIMFTPNRDLVNRLARRSLEMVGDTCWHCHAGVGAFPLQIAVKYKIPLVVWGESVAEASGRKMYKREKENVVKDIFDRDYFTKVSAKINCEKMACDYISIRDLFPFQLPSQEEYDCAEVRGIHLGDYIFWDDERQTEFVRDTYGWKETEMEGTYKYYKSAECIMPGMHDFTCYLKRGFGRATCHACADIRNGLLSRREGFKLIQKHDPERPDALDYYLRVTGLTEKEFYKIMEKQKVKALQGIKTPVIDKSKRMVIKTILEHLSDELG